MNQEARYKLLKCNFNMSCEAGIVLEQKDVMLYSKLSSISISDNNVTIDPGPNGHISFISMNIRQPLSRQSNIPMDFLPTFFNQSPRKQFDLPLLDEFGEVASYAVTFGALLAL